MGDLLGTREDASGNDGGKEVGQKHAGIGEKAFVGMSMRRCHPQDQVCEPLHGHEVHSDPQGIASNRSCDPGSSQSNNSNSDSREKVWDLTRRSRVAEDGQRRRSDGESQGSSRSECFRPHTKECRCLIAVMT